MNINKKIFAILAILTLILPMSASAFDEDNPATYTVSVISTALRTFSVTLKDNSCTTIQFKAKPGTNNIDPTNATGAPCQNSTTPPYIPYGKLNNTGEVNANFSSAFSSDFPTGINVTESNVSVMTGEITLNSSYKVLVNGLNVVPGANVSAFIKADIDSGVVEQTYPNSITFKNYLPILQSITVVGPSPVYTTANGKKKYTASGPDQFGNAYPVKPTWTSSNGTVGTMDGDNSGNLTALVTGTTLVNATDSGVNGTKSVDVVILTAIDISGLDTVYYNPEAANTYTYTLTGTKDIGGTVSPVPADSWSSSNTALATISPTGILTTKATGSVTITAKVGTLTQTKIITIS